jgi:hypothetical protein
MGQKINIQTLSAKFCNIYLQNLAEFREIIATKFREILQKINFCINFVFREIQKINFRIHPTWPGTLSSLYSILKKKSD